MRCNRNTRRLLLTGDRSALALEHGAQFVVFGSCACHSRLDGTDCAWQLVALVRVATKVGISFKKKLQGSRFYAEGFCVY